MAGTVQWIMELLDRTSAPASVIDKKLALIEKRLEGITKAEAAAKTDKSKDSLMFQRMGLEIQQHQLLGIKKAEKATESWVTRLDHGLGVIQKIGGATWAVAEKITSWTTGWVKGAIHAAAEKEQQFLEFKNLLHSGDAAKEMLEKIKNISYKSTFNDQQMTSLGRSLLVGGFSARDTSVWLKGFADAAATSHASDEKVSDAIVALKRVKLLGALNMKTLAAIGGVGIGGGAILEQLAKKYGSVDNARAMVKKGHVDTFTAYNAIALAMEKKGNGRVGSVAEDMVLGSSKLLMEKIQQRFDTFFDDLYQTKGFSKFKSFLKNVFIALDSTSESGKRIQASISNTFDRIFTGLFGNLTGRDGLAAIEGIFKRISAAIELGGAALGGVVTGLANGFFGVLMPQLKDVNGLLDGPISKEKIEQISKEFRDLGESIGSTIGKIDKLAVAFTDLMVSAGLMDSEKAKKSPWAYAMKKGWANYQDFKKAGVLGRPVKALVGGLENTYNFATAAGNALFAQEDSEASANGIRPGTGLLASIPMPSAINMTPMNPTVNVTVHAPNATPEAAQAVANKTGVEIRDILAGLLGSAAMSRGAPFVR